MTKREEALSLFGTGFNCAQALMVTYGIDYGIGYETALRVSSTFGGGMGKMGDTCGAVTGGFMIIGLKYGQADAKDKLSKEKILELTNAFVSRFMERNNTIVCRDLLGIDLRDKNKSSQDHARLISSRCPKFVRDAAEIMEEIL